MTVHILLPGGSSTSIDLAPCETVNELKQRVATAINMSSKDFTITHDGIELEGGHAVSDTPLCSGEALHATPSRRSAAKESLRRDHDYTESEIDSGELQTHSSDEKYLPQLRLLCEAGTAPPLYVFAADDIHAVEVVLTSTPQDDLDINSFDCNGDTALHHICRHDSPEMLISHGCDVHVKNVAGQTPLMIASEFCNDEAAVHLLQNGARVEEVDVKHRTALYLAAREKNERLCEMLVLSYGADVGVKDMYGTTPLHAVCEKEHLELCELFLDRGADVNAKNNDGVLPLHLAVRSNHDPICRLLLSHGALCSPADVSGWTPLHYAARRGFETIVATLLEAGADRDAVDNNNETPANHAKYKQYDEVYDMLNEGAY
eukprot:TRINITY_DN1847_c9_g1_i1.p1 TRINITY_DN1847_c9_g1~~TRINITY_DN1847_c9_g1_i1.p1  ORF type:complete len:375 (+),score=69.57 TRINITY_DN1847_c9_g1_i1:57-1181(+)